MKKVLVLGHVRNGYFLKETNLCEVNFGVLPSTQDQADLLLFCGGGDLSPKLYNENYPFISFYKQRDDWEVAWYHWAVANQVPMFGICRGLQLLNVMTGGKLIPHINGHYDDHTVCITDAVPYDESHVVVNSIHHQLCIPSEGSVLLAFAAPNLPEALYFPSIKSLGVQWHPEMMGECRATQYVRKAITTCINFPQ